MVRGASPLDSLDRSARPGAGRYLDRGTPGRSRLARGARAVRMTTPPRCGTSSCTRRAGSMARKHTAAHAPDQGRPAQWAHHQWSAPGRVRDRAGRALPPAGGRRMVVAGGRGRRDHTGCLGVPRGSLRTASRVGEPRRCRGRVPHDRGHVRRGSGGVLHHSHGRHHRGAAGARGRRPAIDRGAGRAGGRRTGDRLPGLRGRCGDGRARRPARDRHQHLGAQRHPARHPAAGARASCVRPSRTPGSSPSSRASSSAILLVRAQRMGWRGTAGLAGAAILAALVAPIVPRPVIPGTGATSGSGLSTGLNLDRHARRRPAARRPAARDHLHRRAPAPASTSGSPCSTTSPASRGGRPSPRRSLATRSRRSRTRRA